MNNKIKRLYEFANFRVDLSQKCLWQNDAIVSLTPKAFETLVVLLESKGQVVDKETLLDQVWKDTFVEEATLTQNISTLRKTLSTFGDGKQFIETIPRRGYRFTEDVREVFDNEEFFVVETLTKTRIATAQTFQENEDNSFNKKKSLNSFLGVVIGLGIALLIGSFLAFQYFKTETKNFEKTQITKLVSSGNIRRATISPDGKYLALVEKRNDFSVLLLRQNDNSTQVEIIPPTANEFIGITFSADSQSIYYSVYESVNEGQPKMGILYRIPILGGVKTEILRDIDSPLAVSVDGNKGAFVRQIPNENQSVLFICDLNADSPHETKITSRPLREKFNIDGLSFSPDGQNIAIAATNSVNPENPFELLVIPTANGEQKRFSSSDWLWMGKTVWLNDNSGIIFTAYKKDSTNFTDEIWFASYPDGELKKITNGINGIYGVSVTDDSKSIIGVMSNRLSSLVVSDLNNPDSALTLHKNFGDNSLINLGIDWTFDGKIFYANSQGSNSDIWSVSENGSDLKQLTNEQTAEFNPVVSGDGKLLVFLSNRNGLQSLMRMRVDGTDVKTLAEFSEISSPSFTPDGKFVYFSAKQVDSPVTLWKISIDGQDLTQITNQPTYFPQISPDGKWLLCRYPKTLPKGYSSKLVLTILTLPEGKVDKQFEDLLVDSDTAFQWVPNENSISYLTQIGDISSIWKLSINEGKSKKILTFVSEEIFRYSWSKDGHRIALEKGQRSDEVIKITDRINSF